MKRLFVLSTFFLLASCLETRKWMLDQFSPEYEARAASLKPVFEGKDQAREKINISLLMVGEGFEQITDLQFFPNSNSELFVLEKAGRLNLFNIENKKSILIHKLNVATSSEQGLLGLAFHPKFSENKKIYLNYSLDLKNKSITRVSEWVYDSEKQKISKEKVILEVEQPYANHNAGQLVFGPEGLLYIGLGDGGWKDDPHDHGQNKNTYLGSLLRIDVEASTGVPKPDVFAFGLRNPWRYTFSPKGELVVADVGQNLWEEISIVEKGDNLGWKIKEASHCFQNNPKCKNFTSKNPIVEYDRTDGGSISGGYFYLSKHEELEGLYIFGDFLSGKLWAIDWKNLNKSSSKNKMISLGKWPILPSTFGRDKNGVVYVADFGQGKIYKIN